MKILITEDDAAIRAALALILRDHGFEPVFAVSCEEALTAFDGCGLVLLDLMLGSGSGLDVLREIRRSSSIPVIIISCLDDNSDISRGLDMGADDYITKPFRPRELVSRIKSVLRRSGRETVLTLGNSVTIDPEKGLVLRDGEELRLSALEYRLLMAFVNHRGRLLTREKLLEDIWDIAGDYVNDNTLTVYIKRLREKLGDEGGEQQIIKTVRGLGYRMD